MTVEESIKKIEERLETTEKTTQALDHILFQEAVQSQTILTLLLEKKIFTQDEIIKQAEKISEEMIKAAKEKLDKNQEEAVKEPANEEKKDGDPDNEVHADFSK